jgi:hypothetical protein
MQNPEKIGGEIEVACYREKERRQTYRDRTKAADEETSTLVLNIH